MARFDILGLQYFTDGGELLGGGKLNFYETGTTTRKDTFSDAAMTIANTNPVTLDADGRAPNIFFAGLAKCVLTDSAGAILETRDPVGDDSASKNGFPTWAADVTYSFNQPVSASDGYIYTSLVNSNIGNDPISSPTDWQLLAKTIGFDDTNNGYVYVVDTAEPLKINAVPKSTINTLVPISTVTASNVATVDFTGLDGTYEHYQIVITNAIPVTDGVYFYLRTSSDNGATFESGAGAYRFNVNVQTDAAQIELGPTSLIGNNGAAENGWKGVINFFNPSGGTYSQFIWQYTSIDTTTNMQNLSGAARAPNATVNALRFFFSSGNIASGTFTLYGVRTS